MTKRKPIVVAELSDGQLVALPAELGADVKTVAEIVELLEPKHWVVTDSGGAFYAGRIVGLWPANKLPGGGSLP